MRGLGWVTMRGSGWVMFNSAQDRGGSLQARRRWEGGP